MQKFKKGDTVLITTGKDKGSEGPVLKLVPGKDTLVVQGKNLYKKHRKATSEQAGTILEIERPLSFGKVMVVCKHCKKPTRVGFKMEGKTKVRYCKKCEGVL